MSRIVISLSGEGRGHGARTISLLEMCRDHSVLVLVPRHHRKWLEEAACGLGDVEFRDLPSLKFFYHKSGRLSYSKSWLYSTEFIFQLRKHLKEVSDCVTRFDPHLAITDFEPLLPRVAKTLAVPHLSLDHQHFLSAIDASQLPWDLAQKVRFLRPSVRLFCPAADHHLVSSFYRYRQRNSAQNYRQIGVLLREDLGKIPSQVGEHLLVYARRGASARWLPELSRLGCRCLVYGFDRQDSVGQLEFRETSHQQFLTDLASCKALVSTAGNQLVGEALSVGKPVLAIPEHGNFEQAINGYFLRRSGMGHCISIQNVSSESIQQFLQRLPLYREAIADYRGSGNQAVQETIDSMLGSQATNKVDRVDLPDKVTQVSQQPVSPLSFSESRYRSHAR